MQKGYSLKSKALAIVMSLALSHLSLVVAWAAPQITGKLITSGNLPVMVNGNSSQGGSSILSGAVVETPDNVSATIQLGDLGEVELAPGTLAVIEFSGNNVKVTLKRGCAALTTNKGTTGSIVNDQNKVYATNSSAEEGVVGDPDYAKLNSVPAQSDGSKRRRLPVCGVLFGGAPPIPAAPAATSIGGGLSGTAIGAIIAGIGGAAIIGSIIGFSKDASPSSPRR